MTLLLLVTLEPMMVSAATIRRHSSGNRETNKSDGSTAAAADDDDDDNGIDEWTSNKMMKKMKTFAEALAVKHTANFSTTTRPIETFDIDLATPPGQRWDHVVTKYRNETVAVMNWVLARLIPSGMEQEMERVANLVEEFWPLELKAELEGIAQLLGLPPGYLLALNLVYELSSACTSIVATSTSNHTNTTTIWHGRNLDFNIPNLQSITVNVRFVQNNQVLYQGTTFVGLVGLFTGMKPNAFSLSQNQRQTANGHWWQNVLAWIFKGGQSSSFLYRHVLQTANDYPSAIAQLQQTPLIAPCYMIVGGITEAAVISRNRNGPADTWTLPGAPAALANANSNNNNNNTSPSWFLVQTNDDHWRPPKDDRRDATNRHMEEIAEHLSETTLYQVLTMEPTLNELTIYTTVMSAETDYYHSVIQYPNTTATTTT